MQEIQQRMIKMLQETDFAITQEQFDSKLSTQPKFLRNFTAMFENLLLFIWVTRLRIWDLHLTSLEQLAKSLFAFNIQNYARFTPVYLSQMYELQESDPETIFSSTSFLHQQDKGAAFCHWARPCNWTQKQGNESWRWNKRHC